VALIRKWGQLGKVKGDIGKRVATKSGPMFACIIDMTYLLWARAIDIRQLREDQIADGRIRIQATKTKKTSGKVVDFVITPQIQGVIDRARAIKAGMGMADNDYLFPTRNGTPYTKSGLFSMWDRARERAGITEPVWFRDLRALGATDALKAGEAKTGIQDRLGHTSQRTTEIYLKEAVAVASQIDLALPWASNTGDESAELPG
jgi:integrase